jgi:hypothetical protein
LATTAGSGNDPPERPAPGGLDEGAFCDLVARRAGPLLGSAALLSARHDARAVLARPLLGELLCQSTQLEELLDEYGTRHNRRWWRFRELTAAIKLFAGVGYDLLHIQHARPFYQLLPIDGDFTAATARAAVRAGRLVERAAAELVKEADRLGVPLLQPISSPADFSERLPLGQLPRDRAQRRMDSAATIVAHLATEFLNLAAEGESLHTVAKVAPEEYAACFRGPMTEEGLRYLQDRFHTLQSLYDTYVAESQVEHLDADLPVLRGHASVIFHLLEVATVLAHYHERHVRQPTGDPGLHEPLVIDAQAELASLLDYAFTHASLYLAGGRRLCQEMLKRYAEVDRVEVPVPNYRGFHVRPATLIAKIVAHYGSEVRMELEGQPYDAGAPLELFRANEKINAWKRRWLAREVAVLPLRDDACEREQLRTKVLDVVLTLAERGQIVIYEQPLRLSETLGEREGTLLEQVTAELARLQGSGQIDINTGLTITFSGDRRVLADIELLARHGYGEDNFGNNIALPKGLSYLRR